VRGGRRGGGSVRRHRSVAVDCGTSSLPRFLRRLSCRAGARRSQGRTSQGRTSRGRLPWVGGPRGSIYGDGFNPFSWGMVTFLEWSIGLVFYGFCFQSGRSGPISASFLFKLTPMWTSLLNHLTWRAKMPSWSSAVPGPSRLLSASPGLPSWSSAFPDPSTGHSHTTFQGPRSGL